MTSAATPNTTPAILKPKLTGWAQAAARSQPKQQQQQQHVNSIKTQKNNKPATAESQKKPKRNGSPLQKLQHQQYNRDEVRAYMKNLFTHYREVSVQTHSDLRSVAENTKAKDNSNWGVVGNSKYKNRKYGVLTDIAKSLRA